MGIWSYDVFSFSSSFWVGDGGPYFHFLYNNGVFCRGGFPFSFCDMSEGLYTLCSFFLTSPGVLVSNAFVVYDAIIGGTFPLAYYGYLWCLEGGGGSISCFFPSFRCLHFGA